MDSVAGRKGFDLLHSLSCDEPSSLGEGFESALQGEYHAFHETSLSHIRKWMTMQHAVHIGFETHSAPRLAKPSEEHRATLQHVDRGEIFRVARVTDDGIRAETPQKQRRRFQAGHADHDIGLRGKLLEIGRDVHGRSAGAQLLRQAAQAIDVSRVEDDTMDQGRQAAGAAGSDVARCSDDEQGRFAHVPAL